LLDTAQGAGLAAATGVRPFLPPLLLGALARANLGVELGGPVGSLLERPGFMLGVLALAVASYAAERRPGISERVTGAAQLVVACGLGALVFAASLEQAGGPGWPGFLGGPACALIGAYARASLFSRVRRRLDDRATSLLPVWADLAALALAGIAIFAPALAFVTLALLVLVVLGTRRAATAKHEGLRILR
jgi:hypothetical protein